MIESDVEKEFRKQARLNGWWCLKLRVINHAGFPDRLLLKEPGRVKFVELKRPGKTARKLQKYVLNRLEKLGFECHVIDRVENIGPVVTD